MSQNCSSSPESEREAKNLEDLGSTTFEKTKRVDSFPTKYIHVEWILI